MTKLYYFSKFNSSEVGEWIDKYTTTNLTKRIMTSTGIALDLIGVEDFNIERGIGVTDQEYRERLVSKYLYGEWDISITEVDEGISSKGRECFEVKFNNMPDK